MGQKIFSGEVAAFICKMHKMHQDNATLDYYAKDQGGQYVSIMPMTPFVFEFFIYNALYQVDWPDSLDTECVKSHPSRDEGRKQNKLEDFLKPYIREDPRLLSEAFLPIRHLPLEGDGLEVQSDSLISAEDGLRFFDRLRELQTRLSNTDQQGEFQWVDSLFRLIRKCRRYIYKVRCNIFHGSKTLGETYDPGQRKRICVYLTFLRCMTGLFFSVCDRPILRTASHFSTEA